MIAWLLAAAAAQEPAHGARPQAAVPTLDARNVVLDARLDEEVWSRATLLDDFHTIEPVEGLDVEPPWEVRLFRTDSHLYLGLQLFEPEPERMVLQNLSRDARLEEDDRVEFLFDTFADGRTAYFFQVSAAGSRGDALIGDNGRRFNKPWNGFWEAEIGVFADRWVAEIRIPFASMAFGEGDTWRANFERYRGADRTVSRWAEPSRMFRVTNVRQGGQLSGFAGAQQGLGLEFRPYAKLSGRDGSAIGDDGADLDLGGEVSWRFTPQMRASLTIETDFAETEVDERATNLSRYPLFFPEKRDFFLQDSNLFQFGEQGGSFGSGGGNLLPFFTRRIGLVDEVEVPIEVGARVAGRAGSWDLGFLGVRTAAAPEIGLPDADLMVLRPAYRLGSDLVIGGLITSGSPSTGADNTVAGADLRWASTTLLPGNFNLNVFGVASDDEAADARGAGYGIETSLRSNDWQFLLRSLGAQSDFLPGMGFVRRPGEWLTSGSVEWEPRPASSTVRKYGYGVHPTAWTSTGGDLISSTLRLVPFSVEWHDGDEFTAELLLDTDRPGAAFEVAGGVEVPAGDYAWERVKLSYEWSDARPLSGELAVNAGSFYDGDILAYGGSLRWRPGARLRLAFAYEENRGSLPDGDFVTRLERLNFDLGFSPQLVWENLLQADNESDTLGVQSRLHWVVEDGRELFLVAETGWEQDPLGSIRPLERSLALKLVWAVRF